jgi:predicted aconitase/predicted aconitase with swiveling domain
MLACPIEPKGSPLTASQTVLPGSATGPVINSAEGLSFWGGVDPETGGVIDVHHPLHGVCLSGSILFMPTSRGSCSGSGVLLDLILTGKAPAALVFREAEDVLTLGALVAMEMFGKNLPVIRLAQRDFEMLSAAGTITITTEAITSGTINLPLLPPGVNSLSLTDQDRAMLAGQEGKAVAQAMRIICAMAAQQGATSLIDVTQGHIDGCIYASPANLTFAEAMAVNGARVRIPTTMNAISVDYANWQQQGVAPSFGAPAARLADAYVRMGCRPTFTCSPYLLDSAPHQGDAIAWAESNAVVFANSVLGARTAKHPDFLDLCIAVTGRAPRTGVYLDENRLATRIIKVEMPDAIDDAFWPLLGYLAGKAAPDRIGVIVGLCGNAPSRTDLKALCAAFGTTSAAPMLHIEGITPEAATAIAPDADTVTVSRGDMVSAWDILNDGPEDIQLVAIGSPHASLEECCLLANALDGRQLHPDVAVIVTAGQHIIDEARKDGTLARLHASGVRVLPDLCWCSISEPVFPTRTRSVMTNSAKYAHYGPGLSGRTVRFGNIAACAEAALTGRAETGLPLWLS